MLAAGPNTDSPGSAALSSSAARPQTQPQPGGLIGDRLGDPQLVTGFGRRHQTGAGSRPASARFVQRELAADAGARAGAERFIDPRAASSRRLSGRNRSGLNCFGVGTPCGVAVGDVERDEHPVATVESDIGRRRWWCRFWPGGSSREPPASVAASRRRRGAGSAACSTSSKPTPGSPVSGQ